MPRPVEPVCHGPRRLLGIRVPALSLAEFACKPTLSPTSMYLTVPKGKNVSIVCRVNSDPISEIVWYFEGRRIDGAEVQQQQGGRDPTTAYLAQSGRGGYGSGSIGRQERKQRTDVVRIRFVSVYIRMA